MKEAAVEDRKDDAPDTQPVERTRSRAIEQQRSDSAPLAT
jgi:hypothetical protein